MFVDVLVSHRYGYGLMDGRAMVLLAEKWTTVPEQRVCTTDVLTVNQLVKAAVAVIEIYLT